MEPIGLTFKKEGIDKYGKIRQGELMLIHRCNKCGKININRIAGDDKQTQILEVFNQSKNNNILRNELKKEEVDLLNLNNEPELKRQLFGR
jgi:molecular chaperone DnaK (HSP70)